MSDVDTTGSISDERSLAENCYSEMVEGEDHDGKGHCPPRAGVRLRRGVFDDWDREIYRSPLSDL